MMTTTKEELERRVATLLNRKVEILNQQLDLSREKPSRGKNIKSLELLLEFEKISLTLDELLEGLDRQAAQDMVLNSAQFSPGQTLH